MKLVLNNHNKSIWTGRGRTSRGKSAGAIGNGGYRTWKRSDAEERGFTSGDAWVRRWRTPAVDQAVSGCRSRRTPDKVCCERRKRKRDRRWRKTAAQNVGRRRCRGAGDPSRRRAVAVEGRRGGGSSRWRSVADEIGSHGLLLLRLRQLPPPLPASASGLHDQSPAWLDSLTSRLTSLVDFDFWHRTVSMRKLYYLTLTYFLNLKYNLYISVTVRASVKMCESIL